MNMKEAENLNSYFNCFINLDKGWEFFVGIKDYVHYINETKEFKAFVDNLKQERSVLLEEESSLEKVSEKELFDSLTKIRAIIAKNKLENNPEIKRITNDIKSYLNPNGGLRISGKLSDNLNDYFFEICRNTPEQKRFDLFKQFIDKSPRRQNIYGNFSFSRTIEKRRDLTYHVEHRDNIELWSDWMRLEQVPPFIEAPNIFTVDLKDGDTKYAYELIKARVEYDKNGSTNELTKIIPLYRNSATKIQTYLAMKLNESILKQSPYNDGFEKLKSIHLISQTLNPQDKIFLILDELFQSPIRYTVKNDNTAIKKLFNIAYFVNVPGKCVPYSKKQYDAIDKTVFGKKKVKEYMRTNKLKKPTIICKSENGKIIVLKQDVFVKTDLIKNIPSQYQHLYIDKTS